MKNAEKALLSPKPKGRAALTFIFVTVLLDVTGFGLIMPVMPNLLMELTGLDISQSATYGGFLLSIYALMQFLCAPTIGNLSDRFGRRPVLILSMFGLAVDYMIMGFAGTLFILFLGRTLSGIAGASHSTAMAYIADITPPEKRAQNFGLIGAAFGVGFILGPVLGGIAGDYGTRFPFFIAAALALINMAYGLLVLPESLPQDRRRAFSWRRANPIGTLMQLRLYPIVLMMIGVHFLFHLAHQVYPAIWTYYTQLKFGWSPRDVGLSLGVVGVLSIIVQGWLIRKILPWLGSERAVWLGLTLCIFSYWAYSVVPMGWMVFPVMLVSSLAGITGPALSGLMSNQIPDNAQGELQGALTSSMSLTAIISPPILTQLFYAFSNENAPVHYPGAPLFVAGLLAMLAYIPYRISLSRRAKQAAGETLPQASQN